MKRQTRRHFIRQSLAATLPLAWAMRPAISQAELIVPPPKGMQVAGEAEVVKIRDGDTVTLSTGQEIRLVGIQAPKTHQSIQRAPAWPHSLEAREALVFRLLNRNVRFAYAGNIMDRHGRGLAHLIGTDGNWVQGWMLAQGHARVYSFSDNRQFVPEMLRYETQARNAGLGLWALDLYRVRQADGDLRPLNFFHLIEGQVQDVAQVRGRIFLNFGEDWREDFTATIEPDTARQFRGDWPDWDAVMARRIRVRGWTYPHNGIAIDVTHPEQIELL